MSFATTINGHRCHELTLTWGNTGRWVADLSAGDDAPTSGEVTLLVGSLSLVGHVHRGESFADSSRLFVVAGKGGWDRTVKPRSYRANSVKLSNVIRDLAVEAGEVWADGFGPSFADRPVGYSLMRPGGIRASEALGHHVASWHVNELGQTVYGSIPVAGPSLARVIEFDARTKIAELAADSPAIPKPGQSVVVNDVARVLTRVVVTSGQSTKIEGYVV